MTQIFLSYGHDDLLPPEPPPSKTAITLPDQHPDRLAAKASEAITLS